MLVELKEDPEKWEDEEGHVIDEDDDEWSDLDEGEDVHPTDEGEDTMDTEEPGDMRILPLNRLFSRRVDSV